MKIKTDYKIINLNHKIHFASILITLIFLHSCGKQVSVTPPDSPPPNGFVFINTYPVGFDIYLDSKERRRITPDSLNWLSTKAYNITLKKDLFRDSTFTINVIEGVRQNVYVDYSTNSLMLGSISCSSNPEGANVFLNDSVTGFVTPVTLKNILPGNYIIKCVLDNYQDASSNVSVSSNNLSNINLTLVNTTLWQEYTTENSLIKTNDLTCIAVDKNDIVWLGTNDAGVLSFNGRSWGGTEVYGVLPGTHINCIAIDKDNKKFIGTPAGFINYDGSKFEIYAGKTSPLPDNNVNAIGFDNEDNWYIGHHKGLTQSSMQNGNRTWVTYDSSKVPDYWVTSIFCDNKDNLWIGTHNWGIAVKHSNDEWERWYTNNCPIINNYIRTFAQAPSGDIWVGFGTSVVSGGELSYFNGTTWQNSFVIPSTSQTAAILINKDNTKLIATDQGLIKFSSSSNVINFNFDNTGVNINNVTGLARDSKGNIWISTSGGGLVEYKNAQ